MSASDASLDLGAESRRKNPVQVEASKSPAAERPAELRAPWRRREGGPEAESHVQITLKLVRMHSASSNFIDSFIKLQCKLKEESEKGRYHQLACDHSFLEAPADFSKLIRPHRNYGDNVSHFSPSVTSRIGSDHVLQHSDVYHRDEIETSENFRRQMQKLRWDSPPGMALKYEKEEIDLSTLAESGRDFANDDVISSLQICCAENRRTIEALKHHLEPQQSETQRVQADMPARGENFLALKLDPLKNRRTTLLPTAPSQLVYISDEMSRSSTELFQLIEFFSEMHEKILENEQTILRLKANEISMRQECAALKSSLEKSNRTVDFLHNILDSTLHQMQNGFNSIIDDISAAKYALEISERDMLQLIVNIECGMNQSIRAFPPLDHRENTPSKEQVHGRPEHELPTSSFQAERDREAIQISLIEMFVASTEAVIGQIESALRDSESTTARRSPPLLMHLSKQGTDTRFTIIHQSLRCSGLPKSELSSIVLKAEEILEVSTEAKRLALDVHQVFMECLHDLEEYRFAQERIRILAEAAKTAITFAESSAL
jgi:hypothetical protein